MLHGAVPLEHTHGSSRGVVSGRKFISSFFVSDSSFYFLVCTALEFRPIQAFLSCLSAFTSIMSGVGKGVHWRNGGGNRGYRMSF